MYRGTTPGYPPGRLARLLASVPVPAAENTDKRKEKSKFKPTVPLSLLRYSGDNIETQCFVSTYFETSCFF